MTPIDEDNKMEDDIQEILEENKAIDKSADLEKEKQRQIMNEFNAEGNMAGTQIFIQNVGSLAMPYKQSPENINLKVPSKKYDLRDSTECSEFVETYEKSEYLAIAIILSTFDVVALGDLPDLQKNLMQYLPLPKKSEDEETENFYSQQNSYISLNTILAVLGGKKFITSDGQLCTGFGEDSKQILANIMEQFPLLRVPIVSWLMHMNEIYKYKTTFEAYQLVEAFSRIISFDIVDAKKRIFAQLYSNPKNVGLLGNLAYKLHTETSLRNNIESIIMQWVTSDSVWLWKAACLAYSFLMEDGIGTTFKPCLCQAIRKRFFQFKKEDWNFISTISMQSKYFRTMIVEIFYSVYRNSEAQERKIIVAQIYIDLVKRSYYRVNSSFIELPFVACDTKQQQQHLSQLITQIMSIYWLRKQLYLILETYLKELSNYDYSARVINHISAYLHNMASNDRAYQQDIIFFLEKCNSKVAKLIYKKLYNLYSREEFNLHE